MVAILSRERWVNCYGAETGIFGENLSKSWLMISWLLMYPCQQQQWLWPDWLQSWCINGSWAFMGKTFSYLCLLCVEKWKWKYVFKFCKIKSSLFPILFCVMVTNAPFIDFSVSKFFYLAKVPVRFLESHSYLTGVTAAELRRHLSNINAIFNSRCVFPRIWKIGKITERSKLA